MSKHINFTRDDLAAAIKDARAKVEPSSAWARSIDRAERNLAAGKFSFDGVYVVLQSATSCRRYVIDTNEPIACPCQDTTGRCWHVSAARLIVRAAEKNAQRLGHIAQPAPAPVPVRPVLPRKSFADPAYRRIEELAAACC